MKHFVSFMWAVALLAIGAALGLSGWLGSLVQTSLQTHLLDWVMGGLCLIWLLIILIVPWDLYFQAQEAFFEIQRARELNIATPAGRSEYVHVLRGRLLWLALAAHLLSAGLVAALAFWTHGRIGYYFAVFYLVSTIFRPAIAGYVYLSRKLKAIRQEAHYPREDVVELRERLRIQEQDTLNLKLQTEQQSEGLKQEMEQREAETRELRQRMQAIGREFESTVSRLTDNQEVIKGIQAFVRLIAQSTQG